MQLLFAMRIYIESLYPTDVNINALDTLKSSTKIIKTIISEEGIFRIENGKIYRMNITDFPTESIIVAGENAVIDKSTIHKSEETCRMPISHSVSSWKYTFYKLRPNAEVSLVLGTFDNTIEDVYFETNLENITNGIEEDISAFLNKAKFCK